jgi:uncharacterized protein (DUF2062 family)
MPRRIFRQLVPIAHDFLRDHSVRRLFGELLLQPNLWHLNRTSVSLAVSVGLFMAFVPLPGQMIFAAAAAILLGCNLPISVAFVWVSNPITMAPLFFASYKVGAWLLDQPQRDIHFEISLDWLLSSVSDVWQPLLLGCLVLGLLSALFGQIVVRLIWRIHVASSWRERRRRRMRGTVTLRAGQLTREDGPSSGKSRES